MKNKTVFKYVNSDNNELIGYHCCSMCSTSTDIRYAKEYSCVTIDEICKQLNVIYKNFSYLTKEKRMFKNLPISKVSIFPETI